MISSALLLERIYISHPKKPLILPEVVRETPHYRTLLDFTTKLQCQHTEDAEKIDSLTDELAKVKEEQSKILQAAQVGRSSWLRHRLLILTSGASFTKSTRARE